jgi:hypothetical protein
MGVISVSGIAMMSLRPAGAGWRDDHSSQLQSGLDVRRDHFFPDARTTRRRPATR